MITEAEEQKLYREIKERFINEKSAVVFIEVDDHVLIKPIVHYFIDNAQVYAKVKELQRLKVSYAIFNYSEKEPSFYFHGKNFHQVETIASGKITDFYRPRVVPIDMVQVKKELQLLGEILRNAKTSQFMI